MKFCSSYNHYTMAPHALKYIYPSLPLNIYLLTSRLDTNVCNYVYTFVLHEITLPHCHSEFVFQTITVRLCWKSNRFKVLLHLPILYCLTPCIIFTSSFFENGILELFENFLLAISVLHQVIPSVLASWDIVVIIIF